MHRDLILASASASRARLLTSAGIAFHAQPSTVDEDTLTEQWGHLTPVELALRLAQAKARDVTAAIPPGALVLGCDSVLAVDGVAHGKPHTAAEATRRWHLQRGRSAELLTGHWLIDTETGTEVGQTIGTVVWFGDIDDDEIADYVATGEPLGVAGAFTLEGRAGPLIDRIEGDPSNVIGLSLPLLRRLLRELEVSLREVSATVGRTSDGLVGGLP